MEATLKVDYSELVAANTSAEKLEQTMRKISGGGGAGAGGGGGGQGGPAETAKSFRQWDTELRHVEHTGRGLLALFGIGGGILGVAHLVTKEIQDWYAMLDKINKGQAGIGKSIAESGPGARAFLAGQEAAAKAAGVTPTELLAARQKGNVGEVLAKGRRSMGVLEAGAAAGLGPETAELAERRAATTAGWDTVSPRTSGQAAGITDAQRVKDKAHARAEILKQMNYEMDPGTTEMSAVQAWWKMGKAPPVGWKNNKIGDWAPDKVYGKAMDEFQKTGEIRINWRDQPKEPTDPAGGT